MRDKAIVLDKQRAVKAKKMLSGAAARFLVWGRLLLLGETRVRGGGRHTENAKKDFQSDLRFGNMRVES